MKIENDFRVGVPIEQAWKMLTDIPAITPCLPGARLTGQDGSTFEGSMKIKVGPVTAEYKGTATILEQDETTHRVVLSAKGRDSRGSGNASADITANMSADGSGTKVSLVTDLKVAGKIAQFGRGVMADVSKKLLGQFAECIEAKLENVDDVATSVAAASAQTVPVGSGAGTSSSVAPGAGTVTSGPGAVASGAGAVASGAGAVTSGAASASGVPASNSSSSASGVKQYTAVPVDDDSDALDLMDVAGGAMAKRAAPVIGALLLAIITWWLLRRRG